MKNRVVIVALVLLMEALMVLASTLFVGGNVARGNEKAYGDNGKILYIYGNDKILADEWKGYLESKDYEVELLPVVGLLNAEYENYRLIIIGTDTNGLWNNNYTEQLRMSRIPVLGIGYGGLDVFTKIGLAISYPHSMIITSDGSVYVPKKLTIYREPIDFAGVPGNIALYNSGADIRGIYKPNLDKNYSVCYAYDSNYHGHAVVAEQDIYTYWAFVQSPTQLTADGDIVLSNLIYYKLNNFVAVPYLINYVDMDGLIDSYTFEWMDAKAIPLGDYPYANYTYVKEDQNYLYFGFSIINTSANDFMYIWFETNNNRSVGTDVGCFYVILSEYLNGVKVRKVQSYNPPGSTSGWGSFEDPDGTNISAVWNFVSIYLNAEVRILKDYLNASLGDSKYLSFGAKVGNSNGYSIRFPKTFYWLNGTTATTLVSDNLWYGNYVYLKSKYKKDAPTIDGVINDEWYFANTYKLCTPNHNYSSLRILHDDTALYLGIEMLNTSGLETIYLYFDTNCDGGTSPNTDDIEIWGGEYYTGFYLYQRTGTGSDWGSMSSYDDQYAFSYGGSYMLFELRIPFSKLNITAGEYKKINMAIGFSYNAGGDIIKLPKNFNHYTPDTWTLSLYPMDVWQTNRVDALDAPESLFNVTVDGQYSYDEWGDAFYYRAELSNTKSIYLYIKNNGTHLLIVARYYKPNPDNLTFMNFYFDSGYDHSGAPQADDFCLRVHYNGSMVEFQGTGTGWAQVTPSGWIGAAQNISAYWSVEIAVELSKLGITPGHSTDLGFMLLIYDKGVLTENWPVADNTLDLSKYARLTSSNNWGGLAVGEINPMSILVISPLVLAATVAITRKKEDF